MCVHIVIYAINLHKQIRNFKYTALQSVTLMITSHSCLWTVSERYPSESKVSYSVMKIALREVNFTDWLWSIKRSKFPFFNAKGGNLNNCIIQKTSVGKLLNKHYSKSSFSLLTSFSTLSRTFPRKT